MDGSPRQRFGDGLSQRRPQQRCTGLNQQGQPRSVCVVALTPNSTPERLEGRALKPESPGCTRRASDEDSV